jgi:pimeloyl-ACP methyl ester carboxylesterase
VNAGNGPNRRKGLWVILTALLLLVVLAIDPVIDLLTAARLLRAVAALASGSSGLDLPVREMRVRADLDGREVEAAVYYPSSKPARRALIFVPGISELGSNHPKLIALARSLADAGFLVVTPDVVPLRNFEISPEPIRQIVFWYRRIPSLEAGRAVQSVGVGGVSFSGTLALIAAARPEIRDSVRFVLGIGCYNDLPALTRQWFQPEPAGESTRYPTRFYAKWIMMLAALDLIQEQTERQFLKQVLLAQLTQGKAPEAPANLGAQAARWYDVAVGWNYIDGNVIARQVEEHLAPSLLRQLDPAPALAEIRCPVFLVHGGYDDLIPSAESQELRRSITRAKCHLLISPFISHTHAWDQPLTWSQRFAAALQTGGFLYRFARVLR